MLDDVLPLLHKRSRARSKSVLLGKNKEVVEIFALVTSTKFRKSSMGPETARFVRDRIASAVRNNKPIKIILLFGGYKQGALSSFPYPEWAEFFNVAHISSLATAIAAIYDPGVEIVYRSDGLFMPAMNGYSREDIAKYTKRFEELIAVFQAHCLKDLPISIRYELAHAPDPLVSFTTAVENLAKKKEIEFQRLPVFEQENKIKKASKNQNLGTVQPEDVLRLRNAYLLHEAFVEADAEVLRKEADGILVAFRKGVPDCLHFGSCSSSSVQFWVGEGFIHERSDGQVPCILSKQQQEIIPSVYKEIDCGPFRDFLPNHIGVIHGGSLNITQGWKPS